MMLLICMPALSQAQLGTISGVVTDQTGGVVAGATVNVVDVARGVTRPLISDAAGLYSAPGLTAGTYTVHVEAAGFKAVDRQNVDLGNGGDVRVDVTLQPGATNQTVTVTESLPLMNTTNAVLAATVETQFLEDLPANGRVYSHLMDFSAGVISRPGQGAGPAVNGVAGTKNQWMIDGVEDINHFVGNGGPLVGAATSTDELTILPLDAIGEVSIISNPSAEFGQGLGAHVEVGLKSGTNAIHGTAYAFGRDTLLDAQNQYLGSAAPKATDTIEQFGASIGGPIKKDKLFYFGNYEGFRYAVGNATNAALATSNSLAAINKNDPNSQTLSLPDAANAVLAQGQALSPMSMALAGCTNGAGGVTCNPGQGVFLNGTNNAASFPLSNLTSGKSDNQITKIDYHPNDHNAINGEYFFGQAFTLSPNATLFPAWNNTNFSRTQAMRAVWVFTPNTTWVNEARFGYDRYNLTDGNGDCNGTTPTLNYQALFGLVGGNSAPIGACGFPLISIASANTLGAAVPIADQNVEQYTYHFVDSASNSHGKHQLKFGGEWHRTIYYGSGAPQAPNGTITFAGNQAFNASTGLEDFFAGDPQSGQVLVGGANSVRVPLSRFAVFFNDDYRATRKLTLNLGLRYEYTLPFVEEHNNFGNFDPTTASGMVQQTNGNALYSNNRKHFGPRLGFSWDVTGKGTTIVRAGASVLYETIDIDDVAASGFGGSLDSVPTGFGLFYCSTGLACHGPGIASVGGVLTPTAGAPASAGFVQVASPGHDKEGVVSFINNCAQGVANNSSCSSQTWAQNVNLFSAGADALNCGDGNASIIGQGGLIVKPTNCSIEVFPAYQPGAYLSNWTFGVQQSLGHAMSLDVSYVGNHLTNGNMEPDLNEPPVGFSTAEATANTKLGAAAVPGITSAASRRPYATKYPYFGNILQYGPGGEGNYDALQITLRNRTYHGLTFNANYSYAHSLISVAGGNNPTILTITNPELSYGNSGSPFQTFYFTATYDIPTFGYNNAFTQGWRLNSAFQFQSAPGITIGASTIDFAGNGTGAAGATHRGAYTWSSYFAPGGNYQSFNSTGFGYVGLRGDTCYAPGTETSTVNPITGATTFTVTATGNMKSTGCQVVPIVANSDGTTNVPLTAKGFPQICQNAAAALPQNAAMNAIDPGISNAALEMTGGTVGGVAQSAFGCWVSADGLAAILAPAQGTFGNMQKSTFEGAPWSEWDLSISKDTKIRERLTTEFRAEFFNFLNTPSFTGGSGSPTSSKFGQSTSTPNGGNPVNGNGGQRVIQLGLKLIF